MPLELIEGKVVRKDIVEIIYTEIIQARIDDRNSQIERLKEENSMDSDLLNEARELLGE